MPYSPKVQKALCNLSGIPSVMSLMDDLIKQTEETRLEHALTVCISPDNRLEIGESVGTFVEVNPPKCPVGTKLVLDFHTHPKGIPDPSDIDLMSYITSRIPVACVGSAQKVPDDSIAGKKTTIHCTAFDKTHPFADKTSQDMKRLNGKIREIERQILSLTPSEKSIRKLERDIKRVANELDANIKDAMKKGILRVDCHPMDIEQITGRLGKPQPVVTRIRSEELLNELKKLLD